jgi:speckle-type POZ protein
VQVQYKFSILDQAGNVAYGLPAKTAVFKSSGGYDDEGDDNNNDEGGHERFIRREDLERREDLIKDDCLTFRCDIGSFAELKTLPLAREEETKDNYDDAADDDEFGLKPDRHHHHGHSGGRRRRRPDDNEFVQWCLAQKRLG